MRAALIVGFVVLGVVAIILIAVWMKTTVDRRARVRASENRELRRRLIEANELITWIDSEVRDKNDMDHYVASLIKPRTREYLLKR